MAKYDQGGGCNCGLNKECECASKPVLAADFENKKYYYDNGDSGLQYFGTPGVINTKQDTPFKFSEGKILKELDEYVRGTYGEHYKTDTIECFDAWIALGDSTATFRNTALKYLWRYGKKGGNNKKDLMKAIHYIMLCMHVDHYLENGDKNAN